LPFRPISMRILWLTESFPPHHGGTSQDCDRIVSSLRRIHRLEIDVAHFSRTAKYFSVEEVKGGKLITMPFADDPAHTINLLYNYLSDPSNNISYTHLVAFGGYQPVLAFSPLKAWLKATGIILLRGNDFTASIFNPVRRSLLHDALHAADMISVLSDDLKQRLQSFYPDVNVVTTPPAICLDNWNSTESDYEQAAKFRQEHNIDNKILIGIIGQLKEKNGLSFFFNCVLKMNFHDQIYFLLIGNLEEGLKNWLEDKKDFFNIIHIPFMEREELLHKYPACDFVAMPFHYDGLPNTLLEASALGIPAIASALPGVKEILPEEANSLLFHPGNANECSQALANALLMTSKQKKELGETLKKRIREEFSAEIEADNYLTLFKLIS